jgi:hypothetical protein
MVGIPIAKLGSMNRKNQICTLNLWVGEVPRVRARNCATDERLNRGFSRLQDIQLVRNHRQDRLFGKSIEERIVWRELLELELQDVDEQIERISAAAGHNPTPEPH